MLLADIINIFKNWWHHQSVTEVIAFITGILCVYLAAKNNIWNWPFAIISVTLYFFIFYSSHLFADMGLQVYFLATNIYGWYYWSRKGNVPPPPITNLGKNQAFICLLVIAAFTIFLGSALHYTSASFPYLDSFCAAISIIAQFFMARRILQNWLMWVFVDLIYIGIYIFKNLHLTAAMYAIYAVLAAIGYIDWRRQQRLAATKQV